MNIEKILSINVTELINNSQGSFNDIYSKFAIIQNRLAAKDELSRKEQENLPMDYKLFRDEVARRVENCRQMSYKRYKYDIWHQEIKSFYEKLPIAIE